jgi:uncharacterized membrane protein
MYMAWDKNQEQKILIWNIFWKLYWVSNELILFLWLSLNWFILKSPVMMMSWVLFISCNILLVLKWKLKSINCPPLLNQVRYHLPITGVLNHPTIVNASFKWKIFLYDKGDYESYRNLLSVVDFLCFFVNSIFTAYVLFYFCSDPRWIIFLYRYVSIWNINVINLY